MDWNDASCCRCRGNVTFARIVVPFCPWCGLSTDATFAAIDPLTFNNQLPIEAVGWLQMGAGFPYVPTVSEEQQFKSIRA